MLLCSHEHCESCTASTCAVEEFIPHAVLSDAHIASAAAAAALLLPNPHTHPNQ